MTDEVMVRRKSNFENRSWYAFSIVCSSALWFYLWNYDIVSRGGGLEIHLIFGSACSCKLRRDLFCRDNKEHLCRTKRNWCIYSPINLKVRYLVVNFKSTILRTNTSIQEKLKVVKIWRTPIRITWELKIKSPPHYYDGLFTQFLFLVR